MTKLQNPYEDEQHILDALHNYFKRFKDNLFLGIFSSMDASLDISRFLLNPLNITWINEAYGARHLIRFVQVSLFSASLPLVFAYPFVRSFWPSQFDSFEQARIQKFINANPNPLGNNVKPDNNSQLMIQNPELDNIEGNIENIQHSDDTSAEAEDNNFHKDDTAKENEVFGFNKIFNFSNAITILRVVYTFALTYAAFQFVALSVSLEFFKMVSIKPFLKQLLSHRYFWSGVFANTLGSLCLLAAEKFDRKFLKQFKQAQDEQIVNIEEERKNQDEQSNENVKKEVKFFHAEINEILPSWFPEELEQEIGVNSFELNFKDLIEDCKIPLDDKQRKDIMVKAAQLNLNKDEDYIRYQVVKKLLAPFFDKINKVFNQKHNVVDVKNLMAYYKEIFASKYEFPVVFGGDEKIVEQRSLSWLTFYNDLFTRANIKVGSKESKLLFQFMVDHLLIDILNLDSLVNLIVRNEFPNLYDICIHGCSQRVKNLTLNLTEKYFLEQEAIQQANKPNAEQLAEKNYPMP